MRHEKTLLIRPEYLNHGGTLFGGYMMLWADEMAYNAASLTFPLATTNAGCPRNRCELQ